MLASTLKEQVKFVKAANAAAAGTSDVDTAVLDCGAGGGFAAATAAFHIGTVTNGGTLKVEVYSSPNSDGSGSTKRGETDTLTYATGADGSDRLLVVEYTRPHEQYVFFRLKRGTANSVVASAVALLGEPFRGPADNAGLLGGKAWQVLGV